MKKLPNTRIKCPLEDMIESAEEANDSMLGDDIGRLVAQYGSYEDIPQSIRDQFPKKELLAIGLGAHARIGCESICAQQGFCRLVTDEFAQNVAALEAIIARQKGRQDNQ